MDPTGFLTYLRFWEIKNERCGHLAHELVQLTAAQNFLSLPCHAANELHSSQIVDFFPRICYIYGQLCNTQK